MIDLNQLILYTQELIKDISQSRKEESSSIALKFKDDGVNDGFMSLSVKYGEVSKDDKALADIPIHVRKAPDDLVRVYLYVYIYMYMYIHMYIYMYIYKCMIKCINVYTH
jgi:hypothetical protein